MRSFRDQMIVSICLCGIPYSINAQSIEARRAPSAESLEPTTAEKDARLDWWREARFGMFINWGVYSILGGTWQGVPKMGYAEHAQRAFKIPIPVYRDELAGKFNPTKFDADEITGQELFRLRSLSPKPVLPERISTSSQRLTSTPVPFPLASVGGTARAVGPLVRVSSVPAVGRLDKARQ